MRAYYNEIDSYAAAWLRNLIAAGHIAPGEVDERSIVNVRAGDLAGYTQCHFFAGIAGWSYALRLAGWPDDKPVWTGSCPCQPLSGAGQRKGHADERHLWPAFHCLIAECAPPIVFGEQVASKDGREWLAGVRADLEALGYACGAADLCAASVGAPHIRQRLFWVADSQCGESERYRHKMAGAARAAQSAEEEREWLRADARNGGTDDGLADAASDRRTPEGQRPAPGHAHWADALWVGSEEVGWRRAPRGIRILGDGIPGRLDQLRALGNAIVPQVAAEFIRAVTPNG